MKKKTKYIVLCNRDMLVDSCALGTISFAKNYSKCRKLDFANTPIPCVDIIMYDQKEDFDKSGIYYDNASIDNVYPDNYTDKWKLCIIRDATFNNIVIVSLQYNTCLGYIEAYDIDYCTIDDILTIIELFIKHYARVKNIDYIIDDNNLRNAVKYIYDILISY